MSEFTPLREAVDTLASRTAPPDFGELQRRATRRGRRRVGVAAAATVAVIAGSALAVTGLNDDRQMDPVEQPKPSSEAPNGWVAVAVDADQDRGDIYLVRPGEDARRLEVAGSDAADEACPAWSPDGTRLLFGRFTGSSDTTSGYAELVIVPVGPDGAVGAPTTIGLDGFDALEPYPCGTWAPDGRWVALRGPGEVWVVDTQTGAIRRLPDLRPIDLEWRPGTDELAIAGDMGTTRAADWVSTPVTVYSVSTDELHRLGSVVAGSLTWSPDGSTLAYEGGDDSRAGLWLVDADGANERLLVADLGEAIHGIGPVWSPTGDRIAYQRLDGTSAEGHEVVLVSVADGTETVIEPSKIDGWYPYSVAWSPDGTTLLYTAWTGVGDGVIAVPADTPSNMTVLTDLDPVLGYKEHRWVPIQMWGRQPG
jgi:dipeptidyl aminopeptidase/acylaminoacyl peptidase